MIKKEEKIGSFLNINEKDFNFEKIKFSLKEIKSIETKYKKIVKESNNFILEINMSDIAIKEDFKTTEFLKELFKKNEIYYNKIQSKYFLSSYYLNLSEEILKKLLLDTMEYFKNYEKEKIKEINESINLLKNEKINDIELTKIKVFYKDDIGKYIVVANDYIDKKDYVSLISLSESSDKISNINNFGLDKKYNNKTYFIINNNFYLSFKILIENKIKEENELNQKLSEKEKELDINSVLIKEENIFGIEVLYDENIKKFKVKLKGYELPTYTSQNQTILGKRSLIGNWAFNNIYMKENSVYKVEFIETAHFPKNDKILPLENFNELKIIKENYEKEKLIWGRKTVSQKITHCDLSSVSFEKYPSIYFKPNGENYLVVGIRKMGIFGRLTGHVESEFEEIRVDKNFNEIPIKRRNIKFSQTLKCIPITYDEANQLLNEHKLANDIREKTLDLNSIIVIGNEKISHDKKEEVLEKILMQSEMYKNNMNKKTIKKQKI